MPADALPYEPTATLRGGAHYSHTYRDILGRAMQAGKITITAKDGGAPVIVDLVGGTLEVDLAPGTYRLAAKLRTVDGFSITESDTVTLA